ncbi:hypothetical protein AB4097_20660 [Microvirga sp. 2MCAF35]|uniref:hypothetical protein n=1 Tax=Microvirga sp. 2MCAF35 TaxID=3232987 RepID=UPI003F9A6710
MGYISDEEAAALTLEDQIALARKRKPDIGEYIVVINDDEMLEWTGEFDNGGWEIYDLAPKVKEWCEEFLNGPWRYRSVLYARGRSFGADYFLHFVEFDGLSDATYFKLYWEELGLD